jgi:putative FmdB family regulatory protein
MPIYEYFCTACDHRFEQLQSMNVTHNIGPECPICEHPAYRAVSIFASFSSGQSGGSETAQRVTGNEGGCCGGGCGC